MMVKTTLRDYLQTTEEAINSGRHEEALTQCQTILSHYPESLEGQRLLGEVYLAQGQYEQARRTFDWLLISDPENVIVYCDRAVMSEKLSDIDTALDCYQQAYELSRGNRQIRQEFNQLDARVGKQGFMLSRAGLARLYMRGDLLSQAIQEWETILTTTPDRLDARTGLLEACWREGLYERARTLASRLLDEYPTNLKALLFLAHTTSIQDMPAARDLLQRAQALDPDLLIAKELFSDLTTNQPTDPFLQLLNKEPSTLHEDNHSPSYPAQEASSVKRESTPPATSSADPLFGWQGINEFPETTHQEPSKIQDTPETFSATGSNAHPWEQAGQNDTPWTPYSSFSGISSDPLEMSQQATDQTADADNEPAWYQASQLQDISNFHTSNPAEMQSREASAPAWLDMLNMNERPAVQEAPANKPEPYKPEPFKPEPELIQETPQPVQPLPAPEVKQQQQPAKTPQPEQPSLSRLKSKEEEEEEALPSFFGQDEGEGEGDLSWPEWLKSLGAAEMDPDQVSTAMPAITAADLEKHKQEQATSQAKQASSNPGSAFTALTSSSRSEPSTPPQRIEQPAPYEQQRPEEFTNSNDLLSPEEFSPVLSQESLHRFTSDYSSANPTEYSAAPPQSWQQELERHASPAFEPEQSHAQPLEQHPPFEQSREETEQHLLSTLESLEHNLLSQGFVPMTGSLSELAQQLQEPAAPQTPPPATFSSAFAALGASETAPTYEPQQPPFSNQNEPGWGMIGEQQFSQKIEPEPFYPNEPDVTVSAQPQQPIWQQEETVDRPAYSPYSSFDRQQDFLSQLTWQQPQEPQQVPQPPAQAITPQPIIEVTPAEPQTDLEKTISAYYTETGLHRAVNAATTSDAAPISDSSKAPPYYNETRLDGELETTMKRPAIRLQSIKQRGNGERSSQSLLGRARNAERMATSKAVDSNKERLLRGYQCQLSGAYDEAMNEYRIIIRNAPEMLGEVISNMRALLKLAPKYAPGYRVLGDAYMRQGEYLQAMEAYNKALTMTKKTKN